MSILVQNININNIHRERNIETQADLSRETGETPLNSTLKFI